MNIEADTMDPWADLDAMLTEAGVGATVDPVPDLPTITAESARALPEKTPTVVSDPGAEQRKALTAKALQASHHAIDVIAETFAARGADFDDAVKALPVLHRVLEHVERLEAKQATATTAPTAILTIVLDRDAVQERPRAARGKSASLQDVIDL